MNTHTVQKPFAESMTFKVAIYMMYAVLAVVILVIAKPFLVPLAWAIVIALASTRMLDRLEARIHINRSLLIIGFILFVLSIIILIIYFFYFEIRMIMAHLPEFSNTLSAKLNDLMVSLNGMGIRMPENIDKDYLTNLLGGHSDILIGLLSEFGKNIGNVFLIGFYLFFLLSFRDVIRKFIAMRFKDEAQIAEITEKTNASLDVVNNYIYGLLLLTGITIVMNYIVFLLFGLEFALFFAVMVGLLNIMPYVGNPIAMVVTFLYSWLTMDTLLFPILIQVGLIVTNFIQDNILKPWFLGDKLHVNAFAIFLSVVIGGYIWGFTGMLLFIPLIGIVKILLERNEKTKPFAVFFAELSQKDKRKIDKQILEEEQVEIG